MSMQQINSQNSMDTKSHAYNQIEKVINVRNTIKKINVGIEFNS